MKSKHIGKTYTVQQIADMLGTSPETVRRWVRKKKFGQVQQTSRKDGNVISEEQLMRFLESAPKYVGRLAGGLATLSPFLGVATIAGTVAAGAIIGYNSANNKDPIITSSGLQQYLNKNIKDMMKLVETKELLILNTNKEIEELKFKIKQYESILDNEQILNETAKQLTETISKKGDKE